MEHGEEFWKSVSGGVEGERSSVWLRVVEERGGPRDKIEWTRAVLSRRGRSSSGASSTDDLSSTTSPTRSPERLYHVKKNFDMGWFRTNEVEAQDIAGSEAATKLIQSIALDDENVAGNNVSNQDSEEFTPSVSLGRKDSLLTASFLSMAAEASSPSTPGAGAESEDRDKVQDQDLYGSYSGGFFSFPTTPSCNEDDESQEDPQIHWPVQSASQSPVQQLQFDGFEALALHEEDSTKATTATAGATAGGNTSTSGVRHITESDMLKHRQQQDELEFSHGSFGFHTQLPHPISGHEKKEEDEKLRRINSKSNFSWKSSCSTTESVLDDERAKEKGGKEATDHGIGSDGEDECEVMHMKVIHTTGKTGLEETQEFPIVYQQVVANRYRIVDTLGKSAFSRAVQAIDLSNGSSVCLKIINNTKESFDQGLDEVRILKKIVKNARRHNSPGDEEYYGSNFGFVEILDYFYYKEHLFIVTELLKANLYEFQQSNRSGGRDVYFTKSRIQNIAKQMLRSISALHSMRILHADLKPENILLENYTKGTIKIIDLGSARFAYEEPYPYVQSRCYRAPEVILGAGYDEKIDIWSIGTILCELYTGKVLFPCNSNHSLLAQIVSCLGPLPVDLLNRSKYAAKFITKSGLLYGESEEKSGNYEVFVPKNLPITERVSEDPLFIEFLLQLLAPDPRWRCSAEEALQLPWLNQPQQ